MLKVRLLLRKVVAIVCTLVLLVTASNLDGTRAGENSAAKLAEGVVQSEKNYRVVGYLPGYRSSVVDKLDYTALTHLNLSFMRYKEGKLVSDHEDSVVKSVVTKCRGNGVKVLIAIGGGGSFDTASKPFNTKESRSKFIGQIIDYVEKHNLDGVDVDIENTDKDILANYEYFVEELREALGENKILTMAVDPWFTKYLSPTIYSNFDFINLMTYDDNIGNGPIASMEQIDEYVDIYSAAGVSAENMVIGVPFYGYGPGGYSDAYTYAHILASDKNNKYSDECIINGSKVYYNGESTIRKKAELSKNYGGIMIWELGQDSYDDNSLLKVIKNVLKSDVVEYENGRVVGYFPSYRANQVDLIDYSVLTHLNLSFMRYSNGVLKSDFSDALVKKVLAHCNEHDVKVLIAIGGGGGFDAESKPFNTKESRAKFIGTIIDYVNKYQLDGVDVDIECTDADIIANYENFVSELRAALGKDKLLTMAVSPWFTKKLNYTIYEDIDFINLMTYDYAKGDGPIAPLSQIETHRIHYTSQGVSVDRMNIGVPFYGYGPGGYDEEYIYSEILEYNSDNRFSDECVINGSKVYYNGEPTIREKARLSKQYGGIMIWELGQDSFGEYSLLQAIKEELGLDEEEETTEDFTENEKTEMEINGCQISTLTEGYRVIYSVAGAWDNVDSVGLIYGIAGSAGDNDMVVGSTNSVVYSYQATTKGILNTSYSEKANATSYAMTMKFINNKDFYNTDIKVRAYAKLSDGSYVYSDVMEYRIYDVADYLYKNDKMNSEPAHNYLYDKVLSFVNPSYERKEFSNSKNLI